ncbi:MAG TPA: hypothetical protein VN345_12600, partial [Blastocatellia bacterium]|nr:hypothetical protein [Blastocatellia bacterium]
SPQYLAINLASSGGKFLGKAAGRKLAVPCYQPDTLQRKVSGKLPGVSPQYIAINLTSSSGSFSGKLPGVSPQYLAINLTPFSGKSRESCRA